MVAICVENLVKYDIDLCVVSNTTKVSPQMSIEDAAKADIIKTRRCVLLLGARAGDNLLKTFVTFHKISKHETVATVVIQSGTCYYKMARAKLMTFHDDKIAYLVELKGLECDVDSDPTLMYKSRIDDYYYELFKPLGINELRCDDESILAMFCHSLDTIRFGYPQIPTNATSLPVYLLWRKIHKTVTDYIPCLEALQQAVGNAIPMDVLHLITELQVSEDSVFGSFEKREVDFWVNTVPDPRDKLGCVGGVVALRSGDPFPYYPSDYLEPSWEKMEIVADYETSACWSSIS